MSYNYNQTTLMGRLTKDPENFQVTESTSKTFFTIAIDRPYRKDDGTRDTDFIPVALWGRPAELSLQMLRKGTPVLVWGRVQVRNYEKDKEKKWITEVVAENFQVLEKKASAEVVKA